MKISVFTRPLLLGTKHHRRGFTVTETLVSLSILTMIFIGFMSLFVSSLKIGANISTSSSVSMDAAMAIQRIENTLREARRFELMEGGTYGNTYLAKDSGGNIIAVTGIHIVSPAMRQNNVSVITTAGGNATTLTGSTALVDPTADGDTLDIYRSDSAGNPAPSNGSYLWAKGKIYGSTLPVAGCALLRSIARWDGAVQFIQPYIPGTNTPMSNEVRIKITTGSYDLQAKEITSENTQGAVTSLSGEHVYLRNHDPNGATSGTAHGKTQYSGI